MGKTNTEPSYESISSKQVLPTIFTILVSRYKGCDLYQPSDHGCNPVNFEVLPIRQIGTVNGTHRGGDRVDVEPGVVEA